MVIFFRQHIPYQKGCDQSVTKHPKRGVFRTEIIFLTDWGPDTFKKIKKKLGAVAQGAFSARKNTHKSTRGPDLWVWGGGTLDPKPGSRRGPRFGTPPARPGAAAFCCGGEGAWGPSGGPKSGSSGGSKILKKMWSRNWGHSWTRFWGQKCPQPRQPGRGFSVDFTLGRARGVFFGTRWLRGGPFSGR